MGEEALLAGNTILTALKERFSLSGNAEKDMFHMFDLFNMRDVAGHSLKVAQEARRITEKYGLDADNAFIAGCLHDIGDIFPRETRVALCESFTIDVLPEERQFPSLLHQKLSGKIALDYFHITLPEILGAIECHTTLRARPTDMDLALFIADKLSWDRTANHVFYSAMCHALEMSLRYAAFIYLEYVVSNKKKYPVQHPWALSAFNELRLMLA